MRGARALCLLASLAVDALALGLAPPVSTSAASPGDWTVYNHDLANTGYDSSEQTITLTTAPHLAAAWTAQGGGPGSSAQPVAVGNLVYWSSWDGILHATYVSGTRAGSDLWTDHLGVTSVAVGCKPPTVGVADAPALGSVGGVPALFVGGGGNDSTGAGSVWVYALDTTTGAVLWKTAIGTAPDDFAWGSPKTFNGSVYIGVASFGDCPLVRGRLVRLSQASGSVQNTFYTTPSGCTGAGVWSSPAIDITTGMLYFSVGAPGCGGIDGSGAGPGDYNTSIVELKAADLSLVNYWQVPDSEGTSDGDFGASPTLFDVTIAGVSRHLLGIADKNGTYYALDRAALNPSAQPVWTANIAIGTGNGPQFGTGSISTSVFDGTNLYVGGGITTIGTTSCLGSLRSLNPTTGALHWQYCAPGYVIGALAGAPGLIVANAGGNVLVLSTAGSVLLDYKRTTTAYWGAPSIANGRIYASAMDASMVALAVPGTPAIIDPPGAPSGVTATPGTGGATVTWTPPAYDGGAAVTYYAVYAYAAVGTNSSIIVTGSSPYTFTGLSSNTYYIFTTVAWNGTAWGAWSQWSAWTLVK